MGWMRSWVKVKLGFSGFRGDGDGDCGGDGDGDGEVRTSSVSLKLIGASMEKQRMVEGGSKTFDFASF